MLGMLWFVGCAPALPNSAHDVGGTVADGEDGTSFDTTDEVASTPVDAGLSDVPTPVDAGLFDVPTPVDAGYKTSCDPDKWLAEQIALGVPALYKALEQKQNSQYDENCQPAVDRSCVSSCDCSFIRVANAIMAAHLKPGQAVVYYRKYWVESTKLCKKTSFKSAMPVGAEHTLNCEEGVCKARGPDTWQEFFGAEL